MKNNESVNNLEKIRKRSGADGLKTHFLKLAQENSEKAAAQLNAGEVQFPTLYHLIPKIDELGLYPALNPRNQIAFALSARILAGLGVAANYYKQASANGEDVQAALRWIFLTGPKADGLSDEFDEAIDNAAALLIRTYGDTTILPQLVSLIFKRNRQGAYIHDLVWALFSARDPQSLKLIAPYLRAENAADKKLARKLLAGTGGADNTGSTENRLGYAAYSGWLKENSPYLYYTGGGYHQTSDPAICGVDLGAKFLCKKISPKSGEALDALTEEENSRLTEFLRLDGAEKKLLADYSHRLFTRNKQQWGKWMKRPLDEQMGIARKKSGGAR